jgi:hypothetical protein
MNEFETRQVLVLNTSHLPKDMAEEADGRPGFVFEATLHPIPYGYWAYCHDDPERVEPEFWQLCCWVREHVPGVNYLVFDCDGTTYEGLTRYDW